MMGGDAHQTRQIPNDLQVPPGALFAMIFVIECRGGSIRDIIYFAAYIVRNSSGGPLCNEFSGYYLL
jgi:hypothetical protein